MAGLMSRTSNVVRAWISKLLDRAEDPAVTLDYSYEKQLEMLQKVKKGVADVVTAKKRLELQTQKLEAEMPKLEEQARQALAAGREDLARAALNEKQKAADMAEGLREEIGQIEQVLRGYEQDIHRLQAKLAEARARQNAIASRLESAVTRAKARELLHGSRTEDAFARFDILERRADLAEGYAEAMGLTGPKSLEEEIAELKAAEKVDAELEELKAALAAKQN